MFADVKWVGFFPPQNHHVRSSEVISGYLDLTSTYQKEHYWQNSNLKELNGLQIVVYFAASSVAQ
jgi:hypothetical protein